MCHRYRIECHVDSRFYLSRYVMQLLIFIFLTVRYARSPSKMEAVKVVKAIERVIFFLTITCHIICPTSAIIYVQYNSYYVTRLQSEVFKAPHVVLQDSWQIWHFLYSDVGPSHGLHAQATSSLVMSLHLNRKGAKSGSQFCNNVCTIFTYMGSENKHLMCGIICFHLGHRHVGLVWVYFFGEGGYVTTLSVYRLQSVGW
jgi:hypothetical protein